MLVNGVIARFLFLFLFVFVVGGGGFFFGC